MDSFATPGPISAEISLQSGATRVFAEARDTTTVEVLPAHAGRKVDVDVAERTRVNFAAGRLDVRAPRGRVGLFSNPGTVDVVVRLPLGSTVRADTSHGDIDADGDLAECWLKTAYGDLRVEAAGVLRLESTYGNISAGRTRGDAELRSGWGKVNVEDVAGPVRIRTSGDIRLRRVRADVECHTGYGHITVDQAEAGLLDLVTSYGPIEIGVAGGPATYLELKTGYGKVRNELVPAAETAEPAARLEIHARTSYGDITIRRR